MSACFCAAVIVTLCFIGLPIGVLVTLPACVARRIGGTRNTAVSEVVKDVGLCFLPRGGAIGQGLRVRYV